jgi:hypothetical protein
MHTRVCNTGKRNRPSTIPAVGGILAAEVRMTVEEYLDLLERTASNVKRVGRAARTIQKETRPARRKAGKAVKGMAAALRKANKMARKKNGSFKKGYDQARVMRMAHQIRRRKK